MVKCWILQQQQLCERRCTAAHCCALMRLDGDWMADELTIETQRWNYNIFIKVTFNENVVLRSRQNDACHRPPSYRIIHHPSSSSLLLF
jgi:hypothetical protein